MGSAREDKSKQVELIRDRFERATASVLLDFHGLDVKADTELRVAFGKVDVEYRVVKNTLVRRAIEGTALDNDEFRSQLVGQTSIAWSYEDPSAAAKVVKAFRMEEVHAECLQVKCGIIDNQLMEAKWVETELASMPGKDEVRAMLLAQLMAPAQSLVRQLTAPGQNLAYVLGARERKLQET